MYPQPPSGFLPPPGFVSPLAPPAPSVPFGMGLRKNAMALASLLMGLVLPLTVGAAFLTVQGLASLDYTNPASQSWAIIVLPILLVPVLPLVYLAAAIMAIVFGHVARSRAKWLTPALRRGWMADIGLFLGYVGLFAGVVGFCGYSLIFIEQSGRLASVARFYADQHG